MSTNQPLILAGPMTITESPAAYHEGVRDGEESMRERAAAVCHALARETPHSARGDALSFAAFDIEALAIRPVPDCDLSCPPSDGDCGGEP